MRVTVTPEPFDASSGYTITVQGGRPPYTVTAVPSPPNPPGVTMTPSGSGAEVNVPPHTPPGTRVEVEVRDSSDPPRAVLSVNHVA